MKYAICGYLTISVFAEVEAENETKARKIASELSSPTLCHQCSGAGRDEDDAWVLNGFDDPPSDAVQDVQPMEGK